MEALAVGMVKSAEARQGGDVGDRDDLTADPVETLEDIDLPAFLVSDLPPETAQMIAAE